MTSVVNMFYSEHNSTAVYISDLQINTGLQNMIQRSSLWGSVSLRNVFGCVTENDEGLKQELNFFK